MSESVHPLEILLYSVQCVHSQMSTSPTMMWICLSRSGYSALLGCQDLSLSCSWKYSRSIVMDGNFKAEHMQPRNPTDELWLMDGRGFMVASDNYRDYLAGTANRPEVSAESTGMIITNLQHSVWIAAITGQLIRQM